MPKKTKKEKVIADYRRKLGAIGESSPPSYTYHAHTDAHPQTIAIPQPMDQAIRKDMVKTLILAAVAIGGEIVLSMILNK